TGGKGVAEASRRSALSAAWLGAAATVQATGPGDDESLPVIPGRLSMKPVFSGFVRSGGGVLVQDIPDRCLASSRTDVSGHGGRWGVSVRGCRRRVWSLRLSPFRTALSPR